MKLEDYLLKVLSKKREYLPKGKSIEDAVSLFILGTRAAGWSFREAAKYTDKFKEKKKGRNRHFIWLLESEGLKRCIACSNVLEVDKFHKNNSRKDGLQNTCISCYAKDQKENPERWRAYTAERRAREINATPPWADSERIMQFYISCPPGMQVDHIIPLKGVLVSGLHVVENLQYLTVEENANKSNKYTVV